MISHPYHYYDFGRSPTAIHTALAMASSITYWRSRIVGIGLARQKTLRMPRRKRAMSLWSRGRRRRDCGSLPLSDDLRLIGSQIKQKLAHVQRRRFLFSSNLL